VHAQSAEPAAGTALPAAANPREGAKRLAWLDALRGIAALAVVFDHGSTLLLEPVRDVLYHVLDLGEYGVFVFFLVSGYIVPASLERRGSVRSFWISRAFRLYPMFALAVGLSAIAYATRLGTIDGAEHHPFTSMAAWLLMLSNLLTGANAPNVTWTLSYEMVFYLLIAALFSWNLHRRSGTWALTWAAVALALGGIIPMAAITKWAGHASDGQFAMNLTADALILGGIVLAATERGKLTRIGASIAALAAVVLVTVNSTYPYPWSSGTILGLMFTGTLIYRAEQGQVSKRKAAVIAVVVLTALVAAGLWHGFGYGGQWRAQWTSSLLLAAATFGLGLACRKLRIPSALAWVGLVSYSLYLLHPLIFNLYVYIPALNRSHPMSTQIWLALAILAVILALSAATYYGVEKPMQRLGRVISKKLARRAPAPHPASPNAQKGPL
jgi:peptidoglycan/LPS O-acetylase OafA/YrhL